MKKIKSVFIALLLIVTVAEGLTFAYSVVAEREAEKQTELLATLRPGYTTMDTAKALFEAHGVKVGILKNARGSLKGPCDLLFFTAANFPPMIHLHLGRLAGITLPPLPPVKTAYFQANLYFINGVLNSINVGYHVGTTGVGYSRFAGDYNFRSSTWRYADGGAVTSIGVASSGPAFDVPFPRFDFNHMYTMKYVDGRTLWPTAPPPTKEFHTAPGKS